MKAKLLCYTLGKKSNVDRGKFRRELYGYRDYSKMGKYYYERQGVLQKTGSEKVMDSVILTSNAGASKIISVLKKYGAKIHMFSVMARKKL